MGFLPNVYRWSQYREDLEATYCDSISLKFMLKPTLSVMVDFWSRYICTCLFHFCYPDVDAANLCIDLAKVELVEEYRQSKHSLVA
jgi:hypothetical protein